MAQFESLVWHKSRTTPRPVRTVGGSGHSHDSLTEWTAPPLGRLGRPLIAEIETYLEFFVIAHAHAPGAADPR